MKSMQIFFFLIFSILFKNIPIGLVEKHLFNILGFGENMNLSHHSQIAVLGLGAQGTSATHHAAVYSDVRSVRAFDARPQVAMVATRSKTHSQTNHFGDMESNYNRKKAIRTAPAAKMNVNYCRHYGYLDQIIHRQQKMLFAVGEKEIQDALARLETIKDIFPYLELYDRERLKQIEPALIYDRDGRERPEEVLGIGTSSQYVAVDFEAMAKTLALNAMRYSGETEVDLLFNTGILSLEKKGDIYHIRTTRGEYTAEAVIANLGTGTLPLFHQMGHASHIACLPLLGSFFMANARLLNGKVYTMQDPDLPNAAVHGDPDITAEGLTRFGPTALLVPTLERDGGIKAVFSAYKSLNLDPTMMLILSRLLMDNKKSGYMALNALYEVPVIGPRLFLEQIRKIVPSLELGQIQYAKGYGGIRPQVINKLTGELDFGSAKILPEDRLIGNITPSPGATDALNNAMKDVVQVTSALGLTFNNDRFEAEIGGR